MKPSRSHDDRHQFFLAETLTTTPTHTVPQRTDGLLPDDVPGLLQAGGAGGGGTALPHGGCLARLVAAPTFGEGAVHALPLALQTHAWGRERERHQTRLGGQCVRESGT